MLIQRCRRAAAFCMVLLLALLSACAKSEVKYEEMETVKTADGAQIKSISYALYGEGGVTEGTVTDAETIAQIYQRLCKIFPGKLSNIGTCDDGLTLRVELENGDCSFEFEGDNIVIEGQQYVAENLGSLKGYIEDLAFGGEASGEKGGNIQADITGPDDAAGI